MLRKEHFALHLLLHVFKQNSFEADKTDLVLPATPALAADAAVTAAALQWDPIGNSDRCAVCVCVHDCTSVCVFIRAKTAASGHIA